MNRRSTLAGISDRFVIEMVPLTLVPISTSPKSIVEGETEIKDVQTRALHTTALRSFAVDPGAERTPHGR